MIDELLAWYAYDIHVFINHQLNQNENVSLYDQQNNIANIM